MKEAVEIRRKITLTDTKEYNDILALSLDWLDYILTNLGRNDEAASIKEERLRVLNSNDLLYQQ